MLDKLYEDVARRALRSVSLEPLRGKSVLLTGSNGLLGSHMLAAIALANREYGHGTKVTCVSRNRPSAEWAAEMDAQGFQFVQLDLVNQPLPPALTNARFDYVVHAATYGQPKKFLDDALGTMHLNSTVTRHLLDLAERSSGSFLFMSSSEIYGSSAAPEDLPFKEEFYGTASPIDQRAAYTSSKRFGETLCKVFDESKRARARIARVSSVYGPGVRLNDDRVLNVFIRRAIEERAVRMMDPGQQRRRWLHVSDALAMLFFIMLEANDLVYNVGGSDLRSIAELAEYIGEEAGVPVNKPAAAAEAAHTKGAPAVIDMSIEKIMREAKLGELMPLREGIKDCVAWTKAELGRNK